MIWNNNDNNNNNNNNILDFFYKQLAYKQLYSIW